MLLVPPTVDIKSYSLGHFDKFRYKVETKATTLWFEFPFNIERHSTAVTLISPKYVSVCWPRIKPSAGESTDYSKSGLMTSVNLGDFCLRTFIWTIIWTNIWTTIIKSSKQHKSGHLSMGTCHFDTCQLPTLVRFTKRYLSYFDTRPFLTTVPLKHLSPLALLSDSATFLPRRKARGPVKTATHKTKTRPTTGHEHQCNVGYKF
jgi:hypothetical protein